MGFSLHHIDRQSARRGGADDAFGQNRGGGAQREPSCGVQFAFLVIVDLGRGSRVAADRASLGCRLI